MTKSPDRLMIKRNKPMEDDKEIEDELIELLAFNESQTKELMDAKKAIMEGGGWGSINIKFERGQIMFIRHEVIRMVGSRADIDY